MKLRKRCKDLMLRKMEEKGYEWYVIVGELMSLVIKIINFVLWDGLILISCYEVKYVYRFNVLYKGGGFMVWF